MQHQASRLCSARPLISRRIVGSVPIVTAIFLLAGGCIALRWEIRDAHATHVIQANRAAVGMPTPDVGVCPFDVGQGLKPFGDSQLAAIAPVLDNVYWFGGLNLGGTSVSDNGLRCVTKVLRLKILYVNGTSITVKGLVYLQGMPNLRTIVFKHGQFSAVELRTLRAAMPGATITDYQ